MTYVTKAWDFHDAISKKFENVIISEVINLTGESAIVKTNKGAFCCESFVANYEIYMKVTEFVE
jgi:hypothetical protein